MRVRWLITPFIPSSLEYERIMHELTKNPKIAIPSAERTSRISNDLKSSDWIILNGKAHIHVVALTTVLMALHYPEPATFYAK